MTDGREVEDSDPSAVRAKIIACLGFALMLGVAVTAGMFLQPSARAAGAQAQTGGELYAQHCASCHQPTGLGIEGTFPPLVGNPAAADAAYVEDVIRDGLSGPLEVLGVQYDEVMPPAVALTDPAEIAEVAQYVIALAGQGDAGQGDTDEGTDDSATAVPASEGATEGEEATGPIVGDPDRGHDLFIGADRFENGGGACVACHTAGSTGNLGGWSLGPDLTDAFQTLGGEPGLTAWLTNPPSATMQPLFVDRPLSEAERVDLAAFLDDASRQDKADSGFDRLSAAGAVGVAILILGMALAWRGMRQTYVEHLRSNGRRGPKGLSAVGKRHPVDVRTQTGSIRSLPGERPAQAERSSR
ncbi:MAG: c-type cytochrome [Acidimicrobiales bacterium]